MGPGHGRVMGAWLVAAIAAAAAIAPLSAAATPPSSGPAATVEEVLVRRGRPDLYAAHRAECLAYVAASPREPAVTWYLFPRRGDGAPRALAGLGYDVRAAVEEACGPDAALFARLAHATCLAPATLIDLLRAPETLAWRPPALPAALRWARLPERGHLGLAEEVGCARVVSSRDGRARIWVPLRERLADGGAAAGVLRGLAFVQVADGAGGVAVHRDRARGEDLHLDAVVDGLAPLPGPRPRWLVTGARTYDAPAPGPLARRFAEVIEADGAGVRLVRGRFQVGPSQRDVLLLQGAEPPGGAFEGHALRQRHLALRDGALVLTSFGDRRVTAAGAAEDATGLASVARLEDGLFRVEGVRWEATAERPGDARVWLSDRWGGADEVGLRGFDEILGMRDGGDAAAPSPPRAPARLPGPPLAAR